MLVQFELERTRTIMEPNDYEMKRAQDTEGREDVRHFWFSCVCFRPPIEPALVYVFLVLFVSAPFHLYTPLKGERIRYGRA